EGLDYVGILGLNKEPAVVAALAVGDALVVRRHVPPGRAAVIRAVEAEAADQVNALRVRPDRDRDDAAQCWQTIPADFAPGDSGIGGFEQARPQARSVRVG